VGKGQKKASMHRRGGKEKRYKELHSMRAGTGQEFKREKEKWARGYDRTRSGDSTGESNQGGGGSRIGRVTTTYDIKR